MCANHASNPPLDPTALVSSVVQNGKGESEILSLILEQMKALSAQNAALQAKVEELSSVQSLNSGENTITSPSVLLPSSSADLPSGSPSLLALGSPAPTPKSASGSSTPASPATAIIGKPSKRVPQGQQTVGNMYPQRVVLTTYPGQVGIKPIPLTWGAPDVQSRGPIVASRHPDSLKIRNAIGAYSGSYSIYKALAIALNTLDPEHKPDYTNTHPPYDLPPQPAWYEKDAIVSLDPWGHYTQTAFKAQIDAGVDARPTISVTKAHIKMAELDEAVASGRLPIDGKVVQHSQPIPGFPDLDPGAEVAVSKAAIEPVWHLPGMAKRFGISEDLLRRALFEETGGMYPELLTRRDLEVFLPPIGGITVYIFGNPAFLSDPSKECTVRVHDECNGSDVFGSDICTCRPYLTYAIEQAALCAQRGGVGLIIYYRKEGRALGEVTKYLVYNSRKRGGDSADRYFKSTELIAGVKDMRFQALMTDPLRWLGVKVIHHLWSMSDMKYDAITSVGIKVLERHDLPSHLIPADGMVEIDAKIAAGYNSQTKQVTAADLHKTIGRAWEDIDH